MGSSLKLTAAPTHPIAGPELVLLIHVIKIPWRDLPYLKTTSPGWKPLVFIIYFQLTFLAPFLILFVPYFIFCLLNHRLCTGCNSGRRRATRRGGTQGRTPPGFLDVLSLCFCFSSCALGGASSPT